MKHKRSHKLRNSVLGLGGLAGAIYLLLPRWDGGFGFLGDGADWARQKVGLEVPDAAPAFDATPEIDAPELTRCELRLDASGVQLAGEAVGLDRAVDACAKAGAADLVVTGDARYGDLEELEAALDAADVDVYTR